MRITAVLLLALVCLNAVSAVSLRKSSEAIKTSFAVERLRHVNDYFILFAIILGIIQITIL